MKIHDFNERLKNAILIADGAMGSMLHEAVGPQRCFDELNATEPEAVFRVHQEYIEAGAQIIETNTFGANRFKLGPLGLGPAGEVVAEHPGGVGPAAQGAEDGGDGQEARQLGHGCLPFAVSRDAPAERAT